MKEQIGFGSETPSMREGVFRLKKALIIRDQKRSSTSRSPAVPFGRQLKNAHVQSAGFRKYDYVFTTEAPRTPREIHFFVYREIPIDENNPH
jgi:hypothetical protein